VSAPAASPAYFPTAKAVLRVVLIVVAVVLTLWLMYLLRQPLTWIFIAAFLAIALSGPIAFLSNHMRRGFAIAIVYVLLILTPFALIALLVPPIVTQANNLVQNLPEYAQEVTQFVNENDRLRQLQDDYDITGKLEEQAAKLPERLGDAAGVLGDIGVGLVNSVFAAVTILVLSLFILSSGRKFLDAWIREYQPAREEWWHNLFGRIANAIGNYVAGALLQATIAGFVSWIVLMLLGVDFALPLAVLIFLLDLIPLVGAIQPRIQSRAVQLDPLIVLTSVLFGSALFGVLGALLAIPVAAALQITYREYRAERRAAPPPVATPGPGPKPAVP
jgi:predicted PurR-regulated permease PerM